MDVKIPVAMNAFFKANAITSKAHLDACGRARLYDYVKTHGATHWASLAHPESYVQARYTLVLEGYKHYKGPATASAPSSPRSDTPSAAVAIAEADSFLAEMEALLSTPAVPAPVFIAAAARVDEKAAAKAAKAAAAEVAKPTPYDGLHVLDGTLYMVDEKTNTVFDYDVTTETVGNRVGLWVDGIIEYAEPLASAIPGTCFLGPGVARTVVATVVAPEPPASSPIVAAAGSEPPPLLVLTPEPVIGIRISDRSTAEARIGHVCTYVTKKGREYGRILGATATDMALERLCVTAAGTFEPHDVPVCPTSKNRVNYDRVVCCVEEPATVIATVVAPEPEPAPVPSAAAVAKAAKAAEKEAKVAAKAARAEAAAIVKAATRARIQADIVRLESRLAALPATPRGAADTDILRGRIAKLHIKLAEL